jgi:hypothetical protein
MTRYSARWVKRLKGKFARFLYPRVNSDAIKSYLELRTVQIVDVRDTKKQPLEPATIRDNPLIRRGRFLLITRDLNKGADRKFYLDSISQLEVSRTPRLAASKEPGPCHVALAYGSELREIADDGVRLSEGEAGRWLDRFNEAMMLTPWRAVIVRPNSLACDLPNGSRACGPRP